MPMKRQASDSLQRIGDQLKREYLAQKVILFGSYAAGKASRHSDVDILVIAPTKERFFNRLASVKRLIRGARGGLPISPIVHTPKEIEKRRKAGDQFILDILAKGIEL